MTVDQAIVLSIILCIAYSKLKKEISAVTLEELLFFQYVIGIAAGSKSFATLGKSPLYMTEISLALILFVVFIRWIPHRNMKINRILIPYLIILALLWVNAIRVLLLNLDYGFDAFRDSVIVFYSIWIVVTIYILRKKQNWKILAYLLTAVAVFCGYKYLQSIFEFLVFKKLPGFEGFRFGAGYVAPTLFILFALCFQRSINKKYWFLILLLCMANVTLFHRSIYLGMFLSLISLWILLPKKESKRVFAFSVVGFVVSISMAFCIYLAIGIQSESVIRYVKSKASTSEGNVSYRTRAWSYGWEDYIQSPFFGVGVGEPLMVVINSKTLPSTLLTYSEIRSIPWANAQLHNSPLTFLVRYGLFGFGVFTLLHGLLMYHLLRKNRYNKKYIAFAAASVIYMFVYSCFNVVLEGPHDGSAYWIIFGIALSIICYLVPKEGMSNKQKSLV